MPVPFNFTPSKVLIYEYNNQLNVDGSTERQIFEIVNTYDQSVDITRIIFQCNDNVEMHDGLFCGIPELSKPLVLRKKTKYGYYINYIDITTNGKWIEYAFDSSYTEKGKPPDDTYGFSSRLTWAGMDKHGVAIRIEPNESIQLIVQDDLTSISRASLMLEGHFTQD